ncbi:hypothetical protein, partial [Nitrogeniibacter aestuarii]|uniref:hypothetical protein n=1 Tax=Nitrogeniibacter aestuarii TaxID=2815343 RepID=UPI001D0F8DB0
LGELMVLIHQCFLFLGGKWKPSVSQLARSFQEALHFVCESARPNNSFVWDRQKCCAFFPAPQLQRYAD